MKKAFTMVELIFVIVIIGILASVAMSTLSATRDDARISHIVANTRTVLSDITSFYTSQGRERFKSASLTDATNVPLFTQSGCANAVTSQTSILGTFYMCEDIGDVPVITFEIDTNATNLNIAAAADDVTDPIVHGVVLDPTIHSITGGAGQNKDYKLQHAIRSMRSKTVRFPDRVRFTNINAPSDLVTLSRPEMHLV